MAQINRLFEYDGSGMVEAISGFHERQKKSKLAKLLGDAYQAPEAQRSGLLAQMMQVDPETGMQAAKMLDPRFSQGLEPGGLREFRAMTEGMSADDVVKARRVALGLDPRQSSAAIQYKEVIGEDGRARMVAFDPRAVGAQVIGGGPAYGSGVGQPQARPQPMAPARGDMEADIQIANQLAQAGFDPDKIDAWLAQRGQQAEGGGANPFVSQSPMEKAYATETGSQQARLQAAPMMGQIEAQTAGAKEAAQQQAQIAALPERGGIEAQIAAMRARMEGEAKAAAERSSVAAQKRIDAQRTLGLLDQAERLLPISTGSSAGNIVDSVAGAFGHSTSGAQAIAGLQTIAGQLTSSMPRMQGPQSDKDVQLYKQMAGDLANPNIPVPTRLAALRQIRRLNQKYAGGKTAEPRPANGGFRILD